VTNREPDVTGRREPEMTWTLSAPSAPVAEARSSRRVVRVGCAAVLALMLPCLVFDLVFPGPGSQTGILVSALVSLVTGACLAESWRSR